MYHHDTPEEHEERQPKRRPQPLQKDIGGNFEYGVAEEEYLHSTSA